MVKTTTTKNKTKRQKKGWGEGEKKPWPRVEPGPPACKVVFQTTAPRCQLNFDKINEPSLRGEINEHQPYINSLIRLAALSFNLTGNLNALL